MNIKVIVGSLVVIIAIGGIYVFSQKSKISSAPEQKTEVMGKKESEKDESPEQEAMEKKKTMKEEEDDSKMMDKNANSRYVEYSKTAYEAAKDKKRVLFFHAKWCPTCKAANTEFEANLDKIPSDVVLFKTDYDTSGELKTKYGITYQHTFVQVNTSGKQLAKWNGGDINELIQNLK